MKGHDQHEQHHDHDHGVGPQDESYFKLAFSTTLHCLA